MRKFSPIFLICLFSILALNAYAQVGVNTEIPNSLTELEIKNIVNGKDTIPKGIMLPRMTENLRNAIDVKDVNSPNGLFIYNIDEDCYNYYSKEDQEWKSLCGKLGNAKFKPVDCSDVVVYGNYVEGTAIDASNYLGITVDVTKIGSYNISVSVGNGYFFSVQGTALELGKLTIYVPGLGTPKKAQTDKITITGVPLANSSCLPNIIVQSPVAEYSLNCSSTEVKGSYMKKQTLNSSNVITMTINVTKAGSYNIKTPTVNGIRFEASGYWSNTGVQIVSLIGVGTPTTNIEFTMDIKANTLEGNAECEALIPIILPPMTYGIISSSTSGYTWGSVERTNALASTTNFGPTGTFRIKSFTLNPNWSTTTPIANATALMSSGKYPDVILYNAYGVGAPTAAFLTELTKYVNNGGVLIYGTADTGAADANVLLTGIFGSTYSGQAVNLYGNYTDPGKAPYPIANLPSNPIINGPFGNASGQWWEEDNQGSVIVKTLPPNSVQIASASNTYTQTTLDPSFSIVWYNDVKNFVYFGDSTASAYDFTPFNDGWPSLYVQSQNWRPAPRYVGLSGRQVMCYNSILEFNTIAWAIKKAVVNGINEY